MPQQLAGVERVPQPSPQINSGGDCFACALAAVIRHLCPDHDPPTVAQAWKWFEGQWAQPTGSMERALRRISGCDRTEIADAMRDVHDVVDQLDRYEREPPTQNTWFGIQKALDRAHYDGGYPIRHRTHILQPSFEVRQSSHEWYTFEPAGDFTEHLEAFIAAGWVALASMRYDGAGQYDDQLLARSTDHFVVLDGAFNGWEDAPADSAAVATYNHRVHVVCSATSSKGSYWIDSRDLLRKHGVAGLVLVRREDR